MPSPNLPPSNHRAQFIVARDTRNRRIPGLYIRGGRYYAQLWVDLGNGKKAARRFPLRDGDNQPVRTLSAAREALEIKRHERRENRLPSPGRKPLFADYVVAYFEKAKVQRKRPGTVIHEGPRSHTKRRENAAPSCDFVDSLLAHWK